MMTERGHSADEIGDHSAAKSGQSARKLVEGNRELLALGRDRVSIWPFGQGGMK